MGLDIHIETDRPDRVFDAVYDPDHYFYQHSLSRAFCILMSRRDVVSFEPELDQIGKITGVDVLPLYDMNNYWTEESLEWLTSVTSVSELASRLKAAEQANEKVLNNIDLIIMIIDTMISKLSSISNLTQKLKPVTDDRYALGDDFYFADFNSDKGDGYIGNNFGQDLRNMKSFLAYAKCKGASTVYFRYG